MVATITDQLSVVLRIALDTRVSSKADIFGTEHGTTTGRGNKSKIQNRMVNTNKLNSDTPT
jgi:hypothetical protein